MRQSVPYEKFYSDLKERVASSAPVLTEKFGVSSTDLIRFMDKG